MKISKILLSSVAATAFAGAIASSAVTSLNPELTRDSEMAFDNLGVLADDDVIDILTVKGLPEDAYTISLSQDLTSPYTQGKFEQGELTQTTLQTTDLTGTIDGVNFSDPIHKFKVSYNATADADKKNKLGAALMPDVATVNVALNDHCDATLKYTKSYTVVGTLPRMSFTNGEVVGRNKLYIGGAAKSFNEDADIVTGTVCEYYKSTSDTIYFVLAGYVGDNYSQAAPAVTATETLVGEVSQLSCSVEKVADNDTKVKFYTKDGGSDVPSTKTLAKYWEENGFKGQLYRAIVKYTPAEGGHEVKAKYTIGDGLDINALTLTVDASDCQIAVDTKELNFPQEGGVEEIEISYSGFENPRNDYWYISAYMESETTAPFKAQFVDIPETGGVKVNSADLLGSGKIKLAVKCDAFDATAPTQINKDVLVIVCDDQEIKIPVTRTKPSIALLNASDAAKEIVFGEEIDDVKKEVTFVVKNLLNYYDIDDIEIETSNDAFRVYNVSRVHVKEANVDYGVTVTVLYTPFCDNKDVTGTLYIRNKQTGETIPVALKGIAKTNAKGYTGVENVNAANVAGAAYNVAGAAVNGNAKGIVVVNGKKIQK